MQRARHISIDERRVIMNLHDRGEMNTDETGEVVSRVRGIVHNVVRNRNQLSSSLKSGRPKKLSPQDLINLLRKARTGLYTARQLKTILNLDVCVEHVQSILRSDKHLRWIRMKKKPYMTPLHHSRRLSWAEKFVQYSQNQWGSVIWSEEKKFNLDRPDGHAFYWHDKRITKRVLSRRHTGGGSIMLWESDHHTGIIQIFFCLKTSRSDFPLLENESFSSKGKSELCILEGRLNSISYFKILEEYLLPMAYALHGINRADFQFMPDGARPHAANITRQTLEDLNIDVMLWPSCSPDLKPHRESIGDYCAQFL